MIVELPSDLEVELRLAEIRVAVMDATAHVRSPRRSTRFRVTRNLIVAGAAITALTAGAIIASQGYIDTTATCYESPSLDSRTFSTQGYDASSLDPVAACEANWRPIFGTQPRDLVACTLSDGSAAVFPREDGAASDTDFCAALGLADWDSD